MLRVPVHHQQLIHPLKGKKAGNVQAKQTR
jgi:hypothetical protein